jgi:hypothetical protein
VLSHGVQGEPRAALAAFGILRCDELNQFDPAYYLVHLLKKLPLASFLHAQSQVQAGLLHGLIIPPSAIRLADGRGGWRVSFSKRYVTNCKFGESLDGKMELIASEKLRHKGKSA